MSKGTKQVRLGKLIEMVKNMELRVKALEEHLVTIPVAFSESVAFTNGQIEELKICIAIIKNGYQIDTKEEN